jgi:hypothetical protein
MKKLILLLALMSIYPQAQAQVQPYQCQVFAIPRGQMPYTNLFKSQCEPQYILE